MYPVLFVIPLPALAIPLGATLAAMAALAALVSVVAWRRGRRELLVTALAGSVVAAGLALLWRGSTYTPSDLPIYSYGAFLSASLVAGWYLTLTLAERDRLPRIATANCFFWTALAAIVGARLLYVLTNLDEFHAPWLLLDYRSGGLVAYGGFLGGLVGALLYWRKQPGGFWAWSDAAAPSVAAGLALTRLGCYSFGCDFGKPLGDAAPGWLRTLGSFPRWPAGTVPGVEGSPAWLQHVNTRGLAFDAETSLPVHPTQLYELVLGLLLLAAVLGVRRRRPFAGAPFLVLALGYAVGRFALEWWRDDAERGTWGPELPARVLVLLGSFVFTGALVYGPLRGLRPRRRLTAGVALLALLALTALATRHWLHLAEWSTSQWVALGTALAAAAWWNRRQHAPASALAPASAT